MQQTSTHRYCYDPHYLFIILLLGLDDKVANCSTYTICLTQHEVLWQEPNLAFHTWLTKFCHAGKIFYLCRNRAKLPPLSKEHGSSCPHSPLSVKSTGAAAPAVPVTPAPMFLTKSTHFWNVGAIHPRLDYSATPPTTKNPYFYKKQIRVRVYSR
mgnify:CR=1 FL=1